jgi:hypothetical protein
MALDPRKSRTASGVVGGTATGQALGGASAATPAVAGGAPAAGGAAPAGPPQAAQKAGTGFVNLSQVLEANRPAAQQMGQGLVDAATTKAKAAQTEGAVAKNTYEAAGRAAVLQYDPKKVGTGYNAAVAGYNKAPSPNQQGWAYTDQPQYKAYVDSAQPGIEEGKALAGTKYAGPKDWAGAGVDVAGITSRTLAAQDETAALATAGGRQALLSKQVTGPYSAGNKSLDSALLTSAIGGEGQEVANQYSNLSAMLAQQRGEADASYAANSKATADAAAAYGKDAANLEAVQARNKELLDYEARNRQWNSEGSNPQSPVLQPIPKAGGGYTVPTVQNPYNTPESPTTYPTPRPAPVAPRIGNGGSNLLRRRP